MNQSHLFTVTSVGLVTINYSTPLVMNHGILFSEMQTSCLY